jgi:hypothetical protein
MFCPVWAVPNNPAGIYGANAQLSVTVPIIADWSCIKTYIHLGFPALRFITALAKFIALKGIMVELGDK